MLRAPPPPPLFAGAGPTHDIVHHSLLVSVVGCYFPRDPRSTSLAAKAHGRVGMAIKALQLALSVSYALKHTFGLHVRLVSSGC